MKSTTSMQRDSSACSGGSDTTQGGIFDLHAAPDNARPEQQRDQERRDVKAAVPGFVWTEFSIAGADITNQAAITAPVIHKESNKNSCPLIDSI